MGIFSLQKVWKVVPCFSPKFTYLRELLNFYIFYVHPSIRISFFMHLVIFVAPIFQLNTF